MDDLDYLIKELLEEQNKYHSVSLQSEISDKRKMMRSLMNIRPPYPASKQFLIAQDTELATQLQEKGIVRIDQVENSRLDPRLKLWQGDITRLEIDAIVNAANRQMLGCFIPMHNCIDNAIHSAAGIQLRLECNELMISRGTLVPTGFAIITRGYNLPSRYIIHTVGPIIGNRKVKPEDEYQLASCYKSSLQLADENNIHSIAFCCISTGEYSFPNQLAAEIAVTTVRAYFNHWSASLIETVVFNVFKEIDYSIYRQLLMCNHL